MAAKILKRVVDDPDEPKWRRVNADSKAFVDTMARLPGFPGDRVSGARLLQACGWQASSDGKLVLPAGAPLELVQQQLVQLQCCDELASLFTAELEVGSRPGAAADARERSKSRNKNDLPKTDTSPNVRDSSPTRT